MTTDEENALVKKVLDGDKEAFTPLFYKYKPIFFSNLKKKYDSFYSVDEIEDMSLRFLGKMSGKLHQYDPERAQLGTWITRSMDNFFIDCYKEKMREKKKGISSLDAIPNIYHGAQSDSTEVYLKRKRQRKSINDMVSKLTEEDKIIYEEVFVKERPAITVAKELGVKRSTFDYRVQRFRRRAAELIKRNEN